MEEIFSTDSLNDEKLTETKYASKLLPQRMKNKREKKKREGENDTTFEGRFGEVKKRRKIRNKKKSTSARKMGKKRLMNLC